MVTRGFYLDSCIWLNLFKKEGSLSKGMPYWKIAKDFIEKIIFSKDKSLIYSGLVFKELKYILGDEIFNKIKLYLKKEAKFVSLNEEDYNFARTLEVTTKPKLSFFDYLHIAVCKRLNLVLITRDKDLIFYIRQYGDNRKNLI